MKTFAAIQAGWLAMVILFTGVAGAQSPAKPQASNLSGSYHPFPVSGAIWNMIGDNVFTNAKYEFRFGVYGDTVINDLAYSKIYSLYDTTLMNPESTYFGAVREQEDKKVYLLMPGFDETILYDFGAEEGDTIGYGIGGALCGDTYEFWPQIDHYQVVTTIDSIPLLNGEYRKRWHLTGNLWGGEQWIEGIGSINWFGLFNPLISDIALCGDSYSFACFKLNDEILYLDNINCGTCFCTNILSVEDIFNNRDQRLMIYPNPAREELIIDFLDAPGPYGICISGNDGRRVREFWDVREKIVHCPVYDLPAGFYMVSLTDSNGKKLRSGKLVVGR
jgi:hypothetical protein